MIIINIINVNINSVNLKVIKTIVNILNDKFIYTLMVR